jgi:8-oxo-dGTP pyrophosphatase MutT (NUDIX family)
MTDPAREDPPLQLAATLLLVRDRGTGLEVLMVQRHHRIDFVPGAMVFPGGKADPADADPALRDSCAGLEGPSDPLAAARITSIREAFEECGVLLARPRGGRDLVSAARLLEISARHREDLRAGRIGLRDVVEREDLELACDLLFYFAHWITPERAPRRFDTHFFIAEAPPDQLAAHDGSEAVDSVWTTPAEALAAERSGERIIIFPTLQNLRKLGSSGTVAEALAAAREGRVVTVLPVIVRSDAGPVLRIPADAGYDVLEAPLSELMRSPAFPKMEPA